jgi:hypothetical protein
MADYYPLLAKAVSGLKEPTSETRGAIYERARRALLGQLRAMQPPAPEGAIEREARALDEAIARLELECAARSAAPVAPEQASAFEPAPSRPVSEPPSSGDEAFAPEEMPSTVEDEATDEESGGREALRPAAPRPPSGPRGGMRRFVILAGALAAVVALVAFAAWKLRDRPEDLAKRAPATETAEQKSGGKIAERVGENTAPTPAPAPSRQPTPQPAPTVPIAYRAAVLIQAPSEPGGVKTYVGTVVWRRDSVNRGPNQQLASAIRADIDVPDAGLKVSMTIEKNYEAALSASHTLTIRFEPSSNSAIGDVKAINVPEMRRDDAPRGAPLQGMQVDIAPNVFLVGLYSSSEDKNVDMIRNLAWFDIPMSLASGKIAKVTFEKGAVGTQIINDVFTDWQSAPAPAQQ